jgi:hypothetical protein
MPGPDDDLLDRLEFDQVEVTRPISAEERMRRPRSPLVPVAIAVVALVAAAVWYVRRESARLAPPAAIPAPGPAAAAPAAAPAPAARVVLPPLDASDAFVRAALAQLTAHPQLARWLATDELVRRFVAAVVNVADGSSPLPHLQPMRPAGSFLPRRTAGRWIADPASFARYDAATDLFVSIDGAAAARLFRTLHPLFDLAYAEIGDPASSFDATLARALGRLLAVPVPAPPVELVPQGAVFAFADRALEERPVAEKLLLRLGPDHARAVQRKLAELAAACGIAPR